VTLEVRTYKWYMTHHLVMMMHVARKFHEILFVRLEVVVWRRKKACNL